jgi:hypothetical protein
VAAPFLAAVSTYGVLAYQVILRMWEFGIRLALGSDAAGWFRFVVCEGLLRVAACVVPAVRAACVDRWRC